MMETRNIQLINTRVGLLSGKYVLFVYGRDATLLMPFINREVVVYIDGMRLRLKPRYSNYYSGKRVYMKLPRELDDLWAKYHGKELRVMIETP